MIIVGLTGSIAMGKSTVADIFRRKKIPVFDADQIVHALYSDGTAATALQPHFPEAISDKNVNRKKLSASLAARPTLIKTLEDIVHPMVQNKRQDFLDQARLDKHKLVVLDIPLLLEKPSKANIDIVLVVSSLPDLQRERALARPNMTAEKFDFILSRQMPDHEKRARANYVIENNGTISDLEIEVEKFLSQTLENQHA